MAELKINDVRPWVQYSVTSSEDTFTIPFEFFIDGDIVCFNDTTLQILTTDYTLTGAGASGGGVLTLVTPVTDTTITIFNDIKIQRLANFPLTGKFNIDSLNRQLNKLTAIALQLEGDILLSIKADETIDEITGTEMTLPKAADRANYHLTFDANGDVSLSVSTAAVIESSATEAAAALAAINAKITISTASPTGGSDGDIWYKVTL